MCEELKALSLMNVKKVWILHYFYDVKNFATYLLLRRLSYRHEADIKTREKCRNGRRRLFFLIGIGISEISGIKFLKFILAYLVLRKLVFQRITSGAAAHVPV